MALGVKEITTVEWGYKVRGWLDIKGSRVKISKRQTDQRGALRRPWHVSKGGSRVTVASELSKREISLVSLTVWVVHIPMCPRRHMPLGRLCSGGKCANRLGEPIKCEDP